MSVSVAATPRTDARLWLVAIVASLALNVVVVVVLALLVIHSLIFSLPEQDPAAVRTDDEQVVLVVPIRSAEETATAPEPEAKDRGFARTSPEQASEPAENPRFIGERDTRAASEAEPVAGARELPSQDGIEPRFGEIETTESAYQDGDLAHERDGSPSERATPAEVSPEPVEPSLAEPVAVESGDEATTEASAAPPDRLLEGPVTVDVPVPMEEVQESPKPKPEPPVEESSALASQPKPKPKPESDASSPGFRGHQRRTELEGSISRRGRAALDVENSSLGRYHAALSRAIEKSWQRKVIQNRDFITPGVIRIRVVVDGDGRVNSVRTVDEFGIGVIQRGFTHSAIREADLPAMPEDLKRELDGEPLELLYNFIF